MRTKIILFILVLTSLAFSQLEPVHSGRIRWNYGPTSTRPLNPTIFTLYWNTDSSFAQYWDGDSWENLLSIAGIVDTVIVIVQDSIADIYPIPHDSLDTDTSWVIPGDGLGGGSAVEIGDTITHVVNVDSVTIDILNDTLRADTTKLATINYVGDTLSTYWDTTNVKNIVSDSSQYYYWRAKSQYRFPKFEDMVLWNNEDFKINQDSVFVCYFAENTTRRNYLQAWRDTLATDSHYVHLQWNFIAPRNISSITDTLFILRWKTTSADTKQVAIKSLLYEGSTLRYNSTVRQASTTLDSLIVRKSYGTLSAINAGDEFQLDAQIKVNGDTCYVYMLEERWY